MSVKVKKSANFEINLNSQTATKQIRKNTWKSSEIWKDESNQIAPIDKGTLRQSATITNSSKMNKFTSECTWNTDYSGERNETNKKNPHTTNYVEKGYDRSKGQIKKKMNEKVIR